MISHWNAWLQRLPRKSKSKRFRKCTSYSTKLLRQSIRAILTCCSPFTNSTIKKARTLKLIALCSMGSWKTYANPCRKTSWMSCGVSSISRILFAFTFRAFMKRCAKHPNSQRSQMKTLSTNWRYWWKSNEMFLYFENMYYLLTVNYLSTAIVYL